jgi:hypothetical protein
VQYVKSGMLNLLIPCSLLQGDSLILVFKRIGYGSCSTHCHELTDNSNYQPAPPTRSRLMMLQEHKNRLKVAFLDLYM